MSHVVILFMQNFAQGHPHAFRHLYKTAVSFPCICIKTILENKIMPEKKSLVLIPAVISLHALFNHVILGTAYKSKWIMLYYVPLIYVHF